MLSTRVHAVLIFVSGLVLFTVGLSHQEIIGFESRFYLFALEMWRHGPSWFSTTYQHPYPDYPVTGTVLIYLFSKSIGELNKFSAVFPSACASAITLTVTYLIGALHNRRWGMAAVFFLLFTFTFLMEARTISLDQFVTAVTVVCFYLVYSAQFFKKNRRVFWIIPLFILGFAFRGPLGLIIPTGVVCVFYLLEKDFKKFFLVGIVSAILLTVCSLVLLSLAYHVGGMDFLHKVLQMEVLGRMQQDKQHPPFFFYFFDSFGGYAIAYPLMIFVLIGLVTQVNSNTNEIKLLQKLFGWMLIVLIGLSVPADKKMRYILPIAPALALICGYLFLIGREQKFLFNLKRVFNVFCFIFPLLALVMTVLIYYRYPSLEFPLRALVTFLIAMQVLMLIFIRRDLVKFALAALVFVGLYILAVEPINLFLNRTRDFVIQVENLRHQQHAKIAFYHEGMDGLVIKYLTDMSEEEKPVFIKESKELENFSARAFVIATEENFQSIPFKNSLPIIMRGKIGHKNVVVFNKNVSHP